MEAARPTVFYDGQCPLCSREINHYRRLRGADRLVWVDITRDDEMLRTHGLQKETAMASFHVRDAAGNWHTGARAFIELWCHLPGYHWLSRSLRALRLVPALDWAYNRFARWRLQRRCDSASCNTGMRNR